MHIALRRRTGTQVHNYNSKLKHEFIGIEHGQQNLNMHLQDSMKRTRFIE